MNLIIFWWFYVDIFFYFISTYWVSYTWNHSKYPSFNIVNTSLYHFLYGDLRLSFKKCLSILYLKHQFQRSSRVIFLQITPHSYFKLIRCTPIYGQTAAQHGADDRGPQLWSMHVMSACWLCAWGGIRTHALMEQERKTLGEAV
jgi:hypothetical protein